MNGYSGMCQGKEVLKSEGLFGENHAENEGDP